MLVFFAVVLLMASMASLKSVALSNNDFGMSLFCELLEGTHDIHERKENIVFSPYSIFSALSMLLEGVNGNTKAQLLSVLNLGIRESLGELRLFHSDFQGRMEGTNASFCSQGMFVQDGFSEEVLDEFTDSLVEYYDAVVENVAFPDPGREVINSFVAEKTKGLIKDLLKEGSVDASTVMVLVNALYFRNSWLLPFVEEATKPNQFAFIGENEYEGTGVVDMMTQRGNFYYGDFEHYKTLSMKYQNKLEQGRNEQNYRMIFVLPDSNDLENYQFVEKKMMGEYFVGKTKESEVLVDATIRIPRFEVDYSAQLNEKLEKLGLRDAFLPSRADLSGINGKRDLYVSEIIHQAKINVHEGGTEAAAATAIVISKSTSTKSRLKKSFFCHRSFYFLIVEETEGTVLFQGMITNPGHQLKGEPVKISNYYQIPSTQFLDEFIEGDLFLTGTVRFLSIVLVVFLLFSFCCFLVVIINCVQRTFFKNDAHYKRFV